MWSGLDVRGHVRATGHLRRRGVRHAHDLERILNLTDLSCFLCFRSRLYFSIKQLRTFVASRYPEFYRRHALQVDTNALGVLRRQP